LRLYTLTTAKVRPLVRWAGKHFWVLEPLSSTMSLHIHQGYAWWGTYLVCYRAYLCIL